MPLYAVGLATALYPGDATFYLFNTETLTPAANSIAFARMPSPSGMDAGSTFTMSFASAPTASLLIQASNVDADAQYQTIYTSTNKQLDAVTDITRFAFYRARLVTQSAGGALTVTVKR